MLILNLTQHPSTPDQEGVVDFTGDKLTFLKNLLTFKASNLLKDSAHDLILHRAEKIAWLAENFSTIRQAMIGGLPALLGPLSQALRKRGITPLYAVSDRVTSELAQPDGTVKKVSEVKHLGFLEALE